MGLTVNCHFINGAFVEILNEDTEKHYDVHFINNDTNTVEYSVKLKSNSWACTSKKYFVNWGIKIYDGDTLVYEHNIDFTEKSVLIEMCSSSLGDTLAWFPAVDEFQKKYKCKVYCSTFLNNLFEKNYQNITFIKPGSVVNDIYAQYRIGWFYEETGYYNNKMNPFDFKKFHLQETAFQILGIPFKETLPKLNVPKRERKKQICIGIHSTAKAKYWNNPDGWQTVVDYMNRIGYDVLLITKEHNGWMNTPILTNVIDMTGNNFTLEDRLEQLAESELFIGLGSGLSWLAWASGIKTILISGFSEAYSEFTPTARIINEAVCHGCFNNYRLDPGDWNWCPVFKGTSKEFICTKTITPDEVINAINQVLINDNY